MVNDLTFTSIQVVTFYTNKHQNLVRLKSKGYGFEVSGVMQYYRIFHDIIIVHSNIAITINFRSIVQPYITPYLRMRYVINTLVVLHEYNIEKFLSHIYSKYIKFTIEPEKTTEFHFLTLEIFSMMMLPFNSTK